MMSGESGSDSDYENETPNKTNVAIDKFLKTKPDYISSKKSKVKSIHEMKSKLEKNKPFPVSKRTSVRNDERKKVEECFRDLQSDFSNLCKKFDSVYECIHTMLDRMELIENRLEKLEKTENERPITPSYSDVVNSNESERLEKLEYITSEDERKRRLLHVTLTHPQIDSSTASLSDHVRQFMIDVMKMEPRTVDANMQVNKSSRNNTVIIILSHRRYKAFIYSARKNLRQRNEEVSTDLFVNDSLTSYNFKLLMKLKNEKRMRIENDRTTFASVYSYEGKIFIKMTRNEPQTAALHIKSPMQFSKLLRDLEAPESVVPINLQPLLVQIKVPFFFLVSISKFQNT